METSAFGARTGGYYRKSRKAPWCPRLGERLDVGYAIDVLHPVAARVRTAVEFETPVTS
jgi:hypothetical protein